MRYGFTGLLFFLVLGALAQTAPRITVQYDTQPAVTANGRPLTNAWAGGLNAAQFATMPLNADARPDLVVFDRTNNKISTFLSVTNAAGQTAWQYAPQYEAAFPKLANWFILSDYDGDGKKDLFSWASAGVQVWRNTSAGGIVSWQSAVNPLYHESFYGQANLYLNPTDVPAILDYDGDGDVDIIAFDYAGGNTAVYYQNLSKQRQTTVAAPGLDFKRQGICWGNFSKELCNDFTFGINCDAGGRVGIPNARPEHSGNALTIFDVNGDGSKDIVFGYVSCNNLAAIYNTGPNSEKANFTRFDADFPKVNPVRFPVFPAAYFEDVDGDGLADLLATPNVASNEGYLFDFKASTLFYKNAGTATKPNFTYVQNDFLQGDMIDVGENAAPAFADLDGDGDLDMLVGQAGSMGTNGYRARLWRFDNTGTATKPAFALTDTDFLGLSKSDSLTNLRPYFVDLDGNNSPDLVISTASQTGNLLRWLPNGAAAGQAASFSWKNAQRFGLPIYMSPTEALAFGDVDADGKPDMLVGNSPGNVTYLRNTGLTGSSSLTVTFALQTTALAGIGVDFTNRNRTLAFADMNADGKPELLTISRPGTVDFYRLADKPEQPGIRLDSLTGLGFPGLNVLTATADLTGDGLPDLMIGTQAGGLRFVRNTSEKPLILATEAVSKPWAYPNPSDRFVTILAPNAGMLDVLSLDGRRVLAGQLVSKQTEFRLDLGNLPGGMYLLRLVAEGQPTKVSRVVLGR
ncbi:FG-GAP-like repeat-containing protein [Fibrella aquatilis]|uniref:T9SS type A sorting domain-containing protein n=1 Tax=Fibrella aquatilis TaxID=2817059 RepID=A0A939G945_9BACT|nr:FG-GAP-like repeat-containing protein [Fibrella aquatilis]MBO0934504.1 T9SS type A sorting domain-containing protein [Fibrella aquatilis]